MIKTSIIIPIYNGEEYLEKCVESVLAQTQREIEIILVDDGSTDSSANLIGSYERRFPFIKAIYQQNQKLGAARNAGVLVAQGKYIYFLDADDYIESTLLERCYSEAENKALDYVMFDAEVFAIGEDNEIDAMKREIYDRSQYDISNKIFSGKQFWRDYYDKGGVYTNAYLMYFNKEFFVKNDLFFEPGIFYEDNDWVLRVFQCADKISYLPDKFYFRRIHEGSIMTVRYTDVHLYSIIMVCEKLLKMLCESKKNNDSDMVYPMLESVLWRFFNIFETYENEEKLGGVLEEIKSLYYKLWKEQCKIENEKVRFLILDILKAIEERMDSLKHFNQMKYSLDEKRNEILGCVLSRFPLQENIRLGIYGTGKVCNKFLKLYERFVGKPCANIVYLDSNKESGSVYRDGTIYNVQDINLLNLDFIIITSFIYGEEMREKVQEYIKKEIPIQVVPEIIKNITIDL